MNARVLGARDGDRPGCGSAAATSRATWLALLLIFSAGRASAGDPLPDTRPAAPATTAASPVRPTAHVSSSDRPYGQASNAWDEDLPRKRQLELDGEVAAGEHVVLWFPKGAFAPEDATKLLAELQRGIAAAKTMVARPDWTYQGDRRVYYYLPDAQFVSHAPGGNCAFIPLWRMKERKAPWLHESLHLLLKSGKGDWLAGDDKRAEERMPLWLHEGLADALAIDISRVEDLAYYSPLLDVPAEQLDSLAARTLRDAPSPEVLAAIGTRGKPQGLFGPERVKFAIPFYAGSASFVRFIVKRHGYAPLLAAIDDFDRENETLEREAGEALAAMKAAWLEQIMERGTVR
ncbi:MAG: hypothetical protein KBA72_05890 [Thermoanaerobaculia bacterium]|nr:hypothetical protein [Thermoanaerobaculia bacterium]